jgi:hypothetical protein
MRLKPRSFRIIEGGVDLIRIHGIRESPIRAINPYAVSTENARPEVLTYTNK